MNCHFANGQPGHEKRAARGSSSHRPEGVAAARRVNSVSRERAVPRAELMRLARGKAQRPARYEHTRGDIPGYGSFSNYIDQAWRLNIDINKPAGKASRKR